MRSHKALGSPNKNHWITQHKVISFFPETKPTCGTLFLNTMGQQSVCMELIHTANQQRMIQFWLLRTTLENDAWGAARSLMRISLQYQSPFRPRRQSLRSQMRPRTGNLFFWSRFSQADSGNWEICDTATWFDYLLKGGWRVAVSKGYTEVKWVKFISYIGSISWVF